MNLAEYATKDLQIPTWLLIIFLVWSLSWKGLALWKSSKKNHLTWFILILISNTVGILEILYIFLFSKIKLPKLKAKKNANKIQKASVGKNSKKS